MSYNDVMTEELSDKVAALEILAIIREYEKKRQEANRKCWRWKSTSTLIQ